MTITPTFGYCPPTCSSGADYTAANMTQNQLNSKITITTDKSTYSSGEIITVSGHVSNLSPGQDVAMKMTNSSGDIIFATQVSLDNNGDYSTKINTASSLMTGNGLYTIYAQQGDELSSTVQTQIMLTDVTTPPFPSPQQIQLTSGGTIEVGYSTNPTNPNPGDQVQLQINFISKQSNTIQPHIDYRVIGMHDNNQVFGIPITHTAEGSVKIPIQLQNSGTYRVTVEVDGILFQPIPPETATFSLVVGSASPPSSNNVQVQMTPGAGSDQSCVAANNCYSPNIVNIAPGDTVTWTNNDKVGHTTTSGHPTDNTTGTVWDSSIVAAGKSYSFTFQNPGIYYYFCMVHPWMIGEVAVGESAQPLPPTTTPPTTPPPTTSPPSTNNVIITSGAGSDQSCVAANNCYSPRVVSIAAGDTVTWTNNDKVGHTVTSGQPTDNTTGTVWDSSIVAAGKSYSFTFQNAGDYKYFCMVHPWMIGEVIVGVSSQQSISVTTDKSSYQGGDLATITIQSSSLTAGQDVAVMITDPSGNIITSRTLTTSQSSSTLQVRLPQNAQIGTYNIAVTAFVSGTLFKGTAQFSVTSTNPASEVSIVSVQPTNQQGNPVSSFGKGTTGFAKIVLSSQATQISLVTVNLVNADSTSLGVGIIKMTLNSGQTEIELSFYIPTGATSGTGTIYADVYSDWPTNGGTPLTPESSTMVGIG